MFAKRMFIIKYKIINQLEIKKAVFPPFTIRQLSGNILCQNNVIIFCELCRD